MVFLITFACKFLKKICVLCKISADLFIKMEVFEIIKKKLALCLYYREQTQIFDMNRVLAILFGILPLCSLLLFTLFDADNATDYVMSAFLIVAGTGTLISFIDTTLKTAQIFSFIDRSAKIIEISKHCQPSGIEFLVMTKKHF